jgi:predicted DNA-binding transcriptional regulator AlpA
MRTKEPPGLLDVKGAAALVGVTPDAFYDLEQHGAIGPEPIRLHGRFRMYLRSEILRWMEARCPDRAAWLEGKI